MDNNDRWRLCRTHHRPKTGLRTYFISIDSFNSSTYEVAVITPNPNIKEQEISNLSNVLQLVNGGTGIWIRISVTSEPTSLWLNALNIFGMGVGINLRSNQTSLREIRFSHAIGVQSSWLGPCFRISSAWSLFPWPCPTIANDTHPSSKFSWAGPGWRKIIFLLWGLFLASTYSYIWSTSVTDNITETRS